MRLLDSPMQALRCGTCGASVGVRKSSWDQTSVQWSAETVAACLERRADAEPVFAGCSALRASIREAAVQGRITVPED